MKLLHALTLTTLLISTPAWAAEPPAPAGQGRDGAAGQRPDRFREMRNRLLRQEAKLDDAAAAKTEKVLAQFDDDRRAAHKREAESRKAVAQLVKADSKDEKAYQEALDQVVAAHEAVVQLRVRELGELRKTLGQRDAAKVVVALQAVQRQMRIEMREGRKAWLREQLQRMESEDGGDDAGDGDDRLRRPDKAPPIKAGPRPKPGR